jgi:hypothetical protein
VSENNFPAEMSNLYLVYFTDVKQFVRNLWTDFQITSSLPELQKRHRNIIVFRVIYVENPTAMRLEGIVGYVAIRGDALLADFATGPVQSLHTIKKFIDDTQRPDWGKKYVTAAVQRPLD